MTKKTSIMIIDDEDIVLKSCLRILARENYEIDTAFSGDHALIEIEKKDYDIVITDLMMPGIGGMEVLKILKENRPDITVIIFTGFATVDTVREALKLGAFDYIPKPFTPDELRSVVNNAVKARKDESSSQMLDLMAIVSHELKSPVSAVHTTAETLYKGYFGNLEPEQQRIIESILRNCQYLEDIIRNYLDLSKMEMDKLESFKEEIDFVDDVIMPVIEIPEYSSNIRNMPLETDLSVKPKIFGDANLLKIVVTNLVNNAIKYGRENTPIKISLYEQDGKFVFAVENQGVGISADDIENRLFKRFSRLKQKGTEGIKGSGLGLYMCRKIIDKHRGSIRVESEQGSWVRFLVTIPGA